MGSRSFESRGSIRLFGAKNFSALGARLEIL